MSSTLRSTTATLITHFGWMYESCSSILSLHKFVTCLMPFPHSPIVFVLDPVANSVVVHICGVGVCARGIRSGAHHILRIWGVRRTTYLFLLLCHLHSFCSLKRFLLLQVCLRYPLGVHAVHRPARVSMPPGSFPTVLYLFQLPICSYHSSRLSSCALR